jgi:hypothetical protein
MTSSVRSTALSLVAATLAGCASAQVASSYTVLDASLADEAVQQCSRTAPTIEGSWTPSESDVLLLERHLPDLLDVTSTGCCLSGIRLTDLGRHHRHYVGVIVEGRRLIYINAFPKGTTNDPVVPLFACDGGTSFWGVLFDPETATFSDLAFNGAA